MQERWSGLFYVRSFVAVSTTDTEALAEALGLRNLRPVSLDDGLERTVPHGGRDDAFLMVVGGGHSLVFQADIGLGGLGGKLSRRFGEALCFFLDEKRDNLHASRYVDGVSLRYLSAIQGEHSSDGEPSPGEPAGNLSSTRPVDFARAWGVDPLEVLRAPERVLLGSVKTSRARLAPWIVVAAILLALLVGAMLVRRSN